MKKHFLRLLFFTCLALVTFPDTQAQDIDDTDVVELSSKGPLKIGDIKLNTTTVGLYEKFEATFDLRGNWDNPFDPDQVTVDGVFIAPDGKEIVIPGFFYQE